MTERTARIRILNDLLRQSWLTGKVYMTEGVRDLPDALQSRIAEQVQTFSAFTPDNDPHGEHDFGAFTIGGTKVFWKIDYYDQTMEMGSPDPSCAALTKRVLTIMLAEEY